MNIKKLCTTLFLALMSLIFIFTFLITNKKPSETPDTYTTITSIITTACVFYGILKLEDWKKEKKNALVYSQCTDFHNTLLSFSVFIQLTLNYIYGNHELYRLNSEKSGRTEKENKITITKINIETYKEVKQDLLPLMKTLSSYFKIKDRIEDKYKKEIYYLFSIYTRFCLGVYRPIGENGIHILLDKTTTELKTLKYHIIAGKINNAKIEDIFNLDD